MALCWHCAWLRQISLLESALVVPALRLSLSFVCVFSIDTAAGWADTMTLFKRSEGTLEELNKVLASLETDTGSEIADKKRRLDQMTEMAEILGQNCSKLRKAAQESDPTKVGYTCTCDPECKANTNMHLLFCTNK